MELDFILLANQHLQTDWRKPSKRLGKAQEELQQKTNTHFDLSPQEALFHLAFVDEFSQLSSNLHFWRRFALYFVETLRMTPSLEEFRDKQVIAPDQTQLSKLIDSAPFFSGSEYLNSDCLEFHWQALNNYFSDKIKKFKGSCSEFFQQFNPDIHLIGKIYFHLVENKKGASPFAFMATYSAGLNDQGTVRHRPLSYALTEYEKDQEKLIELLSTVQNAAEESPYLKTVLESGELFYPLGLSPEDCFTFLSEIPLYEAQGIQCRVPNWWRSGQKGASLNVSFGEKKKSLVGIESLIDFHASIHLDGLELTLEEAQEILKSSQGLSFIKGKWVTVDHDKLSKALQNWQDANELMDGDLRLGDALRLVLSNGDNLLGATVADEEVEVSCGTWLNEVLEKMRSPELLKEAKVHKDFQATLRPYQQLGLNWLTVLDSLQFGACLADDMGLGKTVQVIALLNGLRRKKTSSTSLLVVPASLIHNWAGELLKFAPKIKFAIAHPGGGDFLLGKDENIEDFNLIITTYGLVKRDKRLKEQLWHYVILDEAQAIKNAGTAQTKAVKALQSKNRLALTGTPIENSLGDLWSLFDFLNPGLLGNKKEFTRLAKSKDLSRIRQVISPYILRRLKTDKSIIVDLPDKVEINSFAELSKEQLVHYKSEVDKLREAIADSEGIQRKGLVLSSLMKFKQICNHPDQFLGGGPYKTTESGKFQRLMEICETIKEKREKVLVFTQFKEITEELAKFMESYFGHSGLVLHGSISVKKRKEMVARFQSDEYVPFFILSIKAGGTGLNLTAANHVVHFDRWWNPAVENQATDRAFRIGQKKNVMVHKFVCKGTIEEKISTMLEDKQKISDEVLSSSGEAAFITEMENDELIELFSLSGEPS
ncbi:SNF2-related protein [Lentisphaera araneosa HTCC2155]|uniref:SNF2-related protein n=1 Tax=Lentisphaera araneosa HTCC2155 TaxID=313628 RepID=A6DIK8_9BACT|nr:DEAD/DEAH box helicase [Lentisphaera araneosa]EDM28294.1 SNF2-related protein [Lentisphaera araneosa HTCC2155]